MKRTDLTLTAALCASLLLHGLVIDALIERQTHELAQGIDQPPINLTALLAKRALLQTIILLPPPKPAPKPPPPPEELFGERGGKGSGLNNNPGEEPMQAMLGSENQATLTPRPGHPSAGGSSGAPQKPNPLAQQPTAVAMIPFGLPHQPPLTDPLGNPTLPVPPPLPPKPAHEQRDKGSDANHPLTDLSPTTRSVATTQNSTTTQPIAVTPATKPIELAKKPPTTSPLVDKSSTQPAATTQFAAATLKLPPGKLPSATQPQLDHPAKPQPMNIASSAARPASAQPPSNPGQGAAGDPGHRSESESDPFSDHPVVVWRDGKVDARDGRKVKTVKPKLTEAGRIALAAMDRPIIIIRVNIDENGKVTDADYLLRSNKPEIDLPHLQAAYQWEFEPTKDKNGHPRPDTIIIPFVWR